MIEIFGQKGTSEYQVATRIRDAFIEHWKGLDVSPESEEWVKISAGAKLSGYKVSDIDVVIVGYLKPGRRFVPKMLLRDTEGAAIGKKPIEVTNFVIAVEVKDHDARSIETLENEVRVFYKRNGKEGWKSATDQNINQAHALKLYCSDRINVKPFVYRCLVMNGVDTIKLSGVLPRSFDAPQLLTSCLSIYPVRSAAGRYWMSSLEQSSVQKLKDLSLFKVMKPSNLDRRKMDAIVGNSPISEKLFGMLGNNLSLVRGHGGTGKTILLLQTALRAFEERGARTLILTYNVALASDIRRSLSLLGVPSDPEEGGIKVATVMGHTYEWLKAFGIIVDGGGFDTDKYQAYCESAIELLEGEAITAKDLQALKMQSPDSFDFDNVFIDEAQDWPQYESDLLLRLYQNNSIVVADGIDQIVRGQRTVWKPIKSEGALQTINLDTSLRMKSNLTTFCTAIAAEANLNWKIKQNPHAGGGKVNIISADNQTVVKEFSESLDSALEKGNSEIDSLVCIPNSDIRISGNITGSLIGTALEEIGLQVWNGTDPKVRKNYPDSVHQCRVVHYESCRGLEGWVTLLHKADDYWSGCYHYRYEQGLSESDKAALVSLEEIASRYAWQRLMIALTRPVDTLIISLADIESPFSKTLIRLSKRFQDIVNLEF
jgi:hypothetical protein